jgi:hypothetical protein
MTEETKSPRFFGRIWKAVAIAAAMEATALLIKHFVVLGPIQISPTGAIDLKAVFAGMLEATAAAILIAVVVKEMIERDYDDRQFKAMVATANLSKQGVLKVLFSTFFDEATVDEVNRSIFSSTLVRDRTDVTYRLLPHPTSSWLVKLEVTIDYEITNAAVVAASLPITITVANYAAIFRDDEGIAGPILTDISIDGVDLGRSDVAATNNKADRTVNPVEFHLGTRTIKAGRKLSVKVSYVRDKLVCDMELMTMSYHSKRVTLNIENECQPPLEMNMREIGQCSFDPRPRRTTDAKWACSTDGILLQHNGWALYWSDPHLKPSEIPGGRDRAHAAG